MWNDWVLDLIERLRSGRLRSARFKTARLWSSKFKSFFVKRCQLFSRQNNSEKYNFFPMRISLDTWGYVGISWTILDNFAYRPDRETIGSNSVDETSVWHLQSNFWKALLLLELLKKNRKHLRRCRLCPREDQTSATSPAFLKWYDSIF